MKNRKFYIIFIIFLLFIILINIIPIIKYNYLAPPGDDSLVHAGYINNLINNNIYPNQYPPGLHILGSQMVLIMGTNIFLTLKFFIIFLYALSGLSLFVFLRKYFSKEVALISLILVMFSLIIYRTMNDGSYPNIIVFYIFIPLTFLLLLKNNNLIPLILFISAIIFFHHLSTIFFFILLFCFVLDNIIFKKSFNFKKYFIILSFPIVITLPIFINKFFMPILNFLIIFFFKDPSSHEILGYIQKLSLSEYPSYLGISLILLSIFGIIIMIKNIKEKYLFLILWIISFFIFSRGFITSSVAVRFTRELSVPLSISAALFIVTFTKRMKKVNKIGLFSLIIILLMTYSLPVFLNDNAAVRVDNIDIETTNWINDNIPMNITILSSPHTYYLDTLIKNRVLHTISDIDSVSSRDPRINYTRIFYNMSSLDSKQFFENNHVDYIYLGRKPTGWVSKKFENPDLSKIDYIDQVINFSNDYNETIIIYKIK